MRIACWIQNTKTHSEYVIIITFPLPQWLREQASMVRYTYIVCLAGLCHQGVQEVRRHIRHCGTKLSYQIYIPLSAQRKLTKPVCDIKLCGPQEYSRSGNVDKSLCS